MTPTTSRSVFIPPGPRRRSRIATLLIASAVAVLAGCGGSGSSFSRESVEQTMSDAMRQKLPAGMTMDQLQCVEDGDSTHWKCIGYTLKGTQHYTVNLTVTCDSNTRQCLSEPFSYIPS